jgi:hypothetical protein
MENLCQFDKIQFNSPQLQNVYSQAKDHLINVNQKMDAVSNDIKMLESFLKGLAISESFMHEVVEETVEELLQRHQLIWDSERKRLIYTLYSAQAKFKISSPDYSPMHFFSGFEEYRVEMNCPLIETPFKVRQKIYKFLPDFLKNLTAVYEPGWAAEFDAKNEPVPF